MEPQIEYTHGDAGDSMLDGLLRDQRWKDPAKAQSWLFSNRRRWLPVVVAVAVAVLGVSAMMKYFGSESVSVIPRADAQDQQDAHQQDAQGQQDTRSESQTDVATTNGSETTPTSATNEVPTSNRATLGSNVETVVVHVTGAVAIPGVIEMPATMRIDDALTAAGGTLPNADPQRLNLAEPLADGMRIEVAVLGDPPDVGGISYASVPSLSVNGVMQPRSSATATVNINRASASELQTSSGVGPTTADAIILFRESSGPFLAPDELLDVRGIGEAKFEAMADNVTV